MTDRSSASSSTVATAPVPLSIRHLTVGYPRRPAVVEGLTADLPAGRLTVLLGPNAAGKTTLLLALLGQLPPRAGEIRLMGSPLAQTPTIERARRLSFVPQRSYTGFAFTVEQVVRLGLFTRSSRTASIDDELEAADLLQHRHRVFNELSAGQQQRVLLARAMVQARPDGVAMLLDEPGSAMDPRHVHQLMHSLTTLTRAGLAVLVVLHDLNLASRYADDVWLLDAGRLIAAGPADRVLTPPILEPVYGVRLTPLPTPEGNRPVFAIAPQATL